MSINPRPCHSEPVTDVTGVGIRNLLAGNLRKSAEIMRFRNGLPRQSTDWLAMTGFFDSLKRAPRGAFFFYVRDVGAMWHLPLRVICRTLCRAGPACPAGINVARRDTWVPPYESYCAPFGAEHHRQADVRADDPVRPYSAKRCHSEPVTVSLAWESVPLVPYLLTTSRPSDQTETMLCRCVM